MPIPNEASMFAGFDRQALRKEAQNIFEAAPSESSAIAAFSDSQMRAMAMSLMLTWVEQGDYTYAAVEGAAAEMTDLDGDDDTELPQDEQNELNDMLQAVADCFISAGADPDNVASFLDDESDEAGAALGELLSAKMENVTQDDEELIATYATSGDAILEGTIKVIRGGKMVLKKKRIGIPHKMNSLQKAALKKARRKAFTGAAKMKRRKSMRIRTKRGM